jgi:drug/metabolite transporter (DMT)-like permease
VVTSEGTSDRSFTPGDWALLAVPAVIWGASFLLIAEGLESFGPGTITWLRVIFGFLALAAFPTSRSVAIDREDVPRIALLGAVWMAIPMSMFPIAEQWISSSVTGMLNGALPLFAAGITCILLRRLPGPNQMAGLAVGFIGVVAISLPSLQGGSRTAIGTSLVMVAMVSYGIAGNLVVPLQQRYGSIPVIWRAQAVAIVLTTPYGVVGLWDSHFEWKPFLAILALGAVGTGVAFVLAGTLFGRVGATRGAVIAYLIPVVALILGVVFRDETVELLSIAGLALVIVGAVLTSRPGR